MKPLVAWALFDLANTFFAVAMISFYFPLWITEDLGGRELSFSLAMGGSMACVALLMPFCGAVSDASGTRMRFLRWTTYGCAAATMGIGLTSNLTAALVLFALANICYQLGTVFYDALLWSVTTPQRLGTASGFGAACGYLGSMLGLGLLWPFVRARGYQAAFIPSALLFLLFALPSFLTIREPAGRTGWSWGGVARAAAMRLAITVRSARAMAGVWRYLWASFFSGSAINTILIFMAVYTRKVAGFTNEQVIGFFLFSQLFSIAGALLFTRLIPRRGAQRTLVLIWSGWLTALGLLVIDPTMRWLWAIGPGIGFCLGATWATARVLVLELSPKDQLAEMFGLAGLFGRASSILGPILWGLLVWDGSGYRRAIVAMMGLMAIGLWLLRGVPKQVGG